MTETRTYKLSELADIAEGEVRGNADVTISGVCSYDFPKPGYIALALDPSPETFPDELNQPAALIVEKPVEFLSIPFLVHKNPRLAFTRILQRMYAETEEESGIHHDTSIHETAEIDNTALIGPFAVIEANARIGAGTRVGAGSYIGKNVSIGDNTVVSPNVTVLHDCVIGNRCIIHPGTVIGSDGFGYTPTDERNYKVPQIGNVVIGNDVEIGSNCSVDRATLDSTIIEDDVKIDNLVQVAHNVRIGKHTRIAAQAGLSGRVMVEANVVIAGQAGFQNGIKIGEGSMVGGQAGVTRHVAAGTRVSGYPARDHKKSLQLLAATNRLPELIKKVEELEEQIRKMGEKK